jgi:hypothetical protein
MDGSSANGSDGVRGSGVRKKSSGFRERGNAQAAQSVGTWSLGDRKLCFLGVRRDLPRRPQSCAKDRRASPYHLLYGDQHYSPLICARWAQASFCTLRSGVSLAEC